MPRWVACLYRWARLNALAEYRRDQLSKMYIPARFRRQAVDAASSSQMARKPSHQPVETMEPRLLFSGSLPNGIPILNSNPGATTAIYLDFDGHGDRAAYDTDGYPLTFGTAEADAIRQAHEWTSQYYAPFDVNVTTELPTDGSPFAWALTTPDVGAAFATGGLSTDGPRAFVTAGWINFELGNPYAHELGHVFGLGHQHRHNLYGEEVQEYRTDPYEGPILGGFSGAIHQFDLGHAHDPATLQDDVAGITGTLIGQGSVDGLRPDDHGGDLASPTTGATVLTDNGGGTFAAEGIIEKLNDVDAYSFAWTGGVVQVDVAAKGVSSLNPVVRVYDSAGKLVGFDEPDNLIDQGASVTMNLTAGTYHVLVSGWGDYGDIGVYTLDASPGTGTPEAPNVSSNGVALAIDAAGLETDAIALSWGAVPGATGFVVERSDDGVNFTDVSGALAAGATAFTDTGLAAGKTYVYRLTAQGGSSVGTDAYSAPLEAQTLPGAVTDFAVTSLTADTLVLNWRSVHADAGYRIERSTDGLNFTEIATVGTNIPSYTDSGLDAGTLYTYRVTSLSGLPGAPAGGVSVDSSAFTRIAGLTATRSMVASLTVIDVAWADGQGETGYELQRSAAGGAFETIATLAADTTSYTDFAVTPVTEYTYRLVAKSSAYPDAPSRSAVDASVALPGVLPGVGGWVGTDIGSPGIEGVAGEANDVFTVIASGGDIWNQRDQFHFVHQALVGDGEIIAKVDSLEFTHPWSKAGLMVRDTLAADSKHVSIFHTGGNGTVSHWRDQTGGSTFNPYNTVQDTWLRLVREGNIFTTYHSADGTSWTQLDQAEVTMGQAVYIGLATTSHNNNTLATSTYSGVEVTGLAGEWRLAQATGTTAVGTTGEYDGVLIGDPLWVDDAVRGNVLELSGAASPAEGVSLGNPDGLQIEGEITLSAWVNLDTTANGPWTGGIRNIIAHESGNTATFLRVWNGQYQLGSWTPGTGDQMATVAVDANDVGQWVQLTGTYDGTHWRLYKNGQEVASHETTQGSVIDTSGGEWVLGNGADRSRGLDGRISDVRIHQGALTAGAIDAMANPVELRGQWKLNETSGTVVDDASASNASATERDGVLIGTPTWTSDAVRGNVLELSGAASPADGVSLGNPDGLQIEGEITLSAWVNLDTTANGPWQGGIRNIIAHESGNTATFLRVWNGQYQLGSWTPGTGDHMATVAVDANDVGQWVQLTGTYDGTHWRLYKNGQEVASHATSQGSVIDSANGEWVLGNGADRTRGFDGSLDDARIYSGALDTAEVAALAGTQLVGRWEFESNTGGIEAVIDSAELDGDGVKQNGILIGTPTWTSDAVRGNVLELSGAASPAEGVSLSNPTDLQITGEITLSAWVNLDTTANGPWTGGIRNIIAHESGNTATFLRVWNGQYQLGSWTPGTGDHMATVAVDANDVGQWVQLTGTYDGTHWRLYKNGQEVASHATSQGSVIDTANGEWVIGNGADRSRGLDGSLDDARIYRGAMSGADVQRLYRDTLDTDPIAGPDQAVTGQGNAVTINALANDSDDAVATLSITAVTGGAPGSSAIINADNTITYTPPTGWVGNDTLTYTIQDAYGASSSGTIDIRVEGLAHHWALDETTGTTATNTGSIASASSDTLTLSGNPLWDAGRDGNALVFDGSSDGAQTQSTAADTLTGPISFAAWVNSNTATNNAAGVTAGGGGIRDILTHGTGDDILFLRQFNGQFQFGYWDGGIDHMVTTPIAFDDVQQWTHLAGSYNADTGEWKLYKNGVVVAEHTSSVGPITVDSQWSVGNNPSGGRGFDGSIDGIRVYNQTLRQADITALIQAAPNVAPVARVDSVHTDANTAVVISPLVNDSDTPGNGTGNAIDSTLTISGFDAVTSGGATITDNGDGTLTYTPSTGFGAASGAHDTFTYTISDGYGQSTTQTVHVFVGDAQRSSTPNAFDANGVVNTDIHGNHQYTLTISIDSTSGGPDLTQLGSGLIIEWADPSGTSQPAITHGSHGAWGPTIVNNADGTFTVTQRIHDPNVVQHVQVHAYDSTGVSYQAQAMLDQIPVYNAQAEVLSPSEVRLSWAERAIGEGGFHIGVSSDGGQSYVDYGVVASDATVALLRNLLPGTDYHIKVEMLGNTDPSFSAGSTIVQVSMPSRPIGQGEGDAISWYQVAVTTPALQRGDAGYSGTGTASVKGERVVVVGDPGSEVTYELVEAESAAAAVFQAIQGTALITNYAGESRTFTFGEHGAFRIVATDAAAGEYRIYLEDTFQWTNVDNDYNDWYWDVKVTTETEEAWIDLTVGGLGEDKEDTVGKFIPVNNDFDEGNFDPNGYPRPDNSIDAEGRLGIDLADPDLVQATLSLSGDGGTWHLEIPSELFVWQRLGSVYSRVRNFTKTPVGSGTHSIDLVIEGLHASYSGEQSILRAVYEASSDLVVDDQVKVMASGIDVDVDSDNDERLAIPEVDHEEDSIENDNAQSGKIVYLSDSVLGHYTPLSVFMESVHSENNANVRITYDDAGIDGSLGGSIRLYDEASNYIPAGVYTLAQLGFSVDNLEVNFSIEGVTGSTDEASRRITFEVDPDGVAEEEGFLFSDTVQIEVEDEGFAPTLVQGYVWNDLNVDGIRNARGTLLPSDVPHTIFVLDVSGSTTAQFRGDSISQLLPGYEDDINGDNQSNTVLDGEIAGFLALADQLRENGLGNDAEVSLVVFADSARAVDMNPSTPEMDWSVSLNTDTDDDGIFDLEDILTSINVGHGGVGNATNYEKALDQAIGVAGDIIPVGGNLVFMSDGLNNRPTTDHSHYIDEVAELQSLPLGMTLYAYGAGGGADRFHLEQIGGERTHVYTRFNDLVGGTFADDVGELIYFTEPALGGWQVYVDLNNDNQWSPDEPSALSEIDGTYTLQGLAAGTHVIRAIPLEDWDPTAPDENGHTITVADSGVVEGINFGFNTQVKPEITLTVTNSSIDELTLDDYAEIEFRSDSILYSDVSIDLNITGLGIEDTDYDLPESITILAGTDVAVVKVRALYDGVDEGPETMHITLVESLAYDIAPNQVPGAVTIYESDTLDSGELDTDFDGVSDRDEILIHGTDPTAFDSDGDNLGDGFEINHPEVFDPTEHNDPQNDSDGDGLTDLQEQINNTNPGEADSDGDGVNDGTEAGQGSDPNDASDEGEAPSEDKIVDLELTVGDPSYSHSERWHLQFGDRNHQANTFGQVESDVYKYDKGETYDIKVTHAGTNRDSPDYDYRAWVNLVSEGLVVIEDPDELLVQGIVYGGDDNIAQGKVAKAHIALVDLVILTPEEIDDKKEEDPGGPIEPNGDDNDLDMVLDFEDTDGVEGEDDLVTIELKALLPDALHELDGMLTLEFGGDLKVWLDPNKNEEVESGVTLFDVTQAHMLYAEAAVPAGTLFEEELSAVYRPGALPEGYLQFGFEERDTVTLFHKPLVSVFAVDAYASESSTSGLADNGTFLISRGEGKTDGALEVFYVVKHELDTINHAVDATALISSSFDSDYQEELIQFEEGGVYYGKVVIPDGQSSVELTITPVNDTIKEWDETIEIALVTPSTVPTDFSNQDEELTDEERDYYLLADGGEESESVFITIFDDDLSAETILNRNIDTESTGLTRDSLVVGGVSVDLYQGAVTLALPLKPNGYGPIYQGNDNLVPLLPLEIDLSNFTEDDIFEFAGSMTATVNVAGVEGEAFTISNLDQLTDEHDIVHLTVVGPDDLASELRTGHYGYDVTLEAMVDGETVTRTIHGTTEIINRFDNEIGDVQYGQGWWVAQEDRLILDDGTTGQYHGQGHATGDSGVGLFRGDSTTAWYTATTDYADLITPESTSLSAEEDWMDSTHAGAQRPDIGEEENTVQISENGTFTWDFSGLATDEIYQVFATWTPGETREASAQYTIAEATDLKAPNADTIEWRVDQRYTPGEQVLEGQSFRSLGFIAPDAETLSVTLGRGAFEEGEEPDGYEEGELVAHKESVVLVKAAWTFETPDGTLGGSQAELVYDPQTEGTGGDLRAVAYTLSTKFGTSYEFGPDGRLHQRVDRNQNMTRLEYNTDGLLDKITEQGGLVTQYAYNGDGKIHTITDFAGRITTYEIAESIDKIIEPAGNDGVPETEFTYGGPDGRLDTITQTTDDHSYLTDIDYDNATRRITSITAPGTKPVSITPFLIAGLNKVQSPSQGNTHSFDGDSKEPVATYSDPKGKTWSYQMDGYGLTIAMANPLGAVWQWKRDSDGLVTESVEPAGGGGTAGLGELTTSYIYDGTDQDDNRLGNLERVEYAQSGISESWTYSTFNQINSHTDGKGTTIDYGLDSSGNVKSLTIAGITGQVDSPNYSLGYKLTDSPSSINNLAGGLVEKFTDANGIVTETKFITTPGAKNGLVEEVIYALGIVGEEFSIEYDYNDEGNLTKSTQEVSSHALAGNRITEYDFDSLDRLISITQKLVSDHPSATTQKDITTTYEYDDLGRITKVLAPLGRETEYKYDARGLLSHEIMPEEKLSTGGTGTETVKPSTYYEYDDNGNLFKVIATTGTGTTGREIATYTYNERNLVETERINPASEITTYEYDALGNIKSVDVDGYGQVTYEYDNLHRLVKEVQPATSDHGSTITTYQYDGNSNLTHITEPGSRTTVLSYDQLNRLIKETLPTVAAGTPETVYEYDANGNLRYETDANSNKTTFEYDSLNRVIWIEGDGPTSPIQEYVYNLAGDVIEYIDGRLNKTEYTYDTLGRLIAVKAPEVDKWTSTTSSTQEHPVTQYFYDDIGNVERVVDAEGNETKYEHNKLNQLVKTILPLVTLTDSSGGTSTGTPTTLYSYDRYGQQRIMTDANGNITEQIYDDQGLLKQVTLPATNDHGASNIKYTYDPADRSFTVKSPNTTNGDRDTSTTVYDQLGRVKSVSDTTGTTVYTYKNTGVVEKTERKNLGGQTIARTEYVYDDLLRTTEIKETTDFSSNTIETTTHDYYLNGLLKSVTDPAGNTRSFVYDELNRLKTETFAAGGSRAYDYDEDNNLTKITDRNGRTTTYEYDALNRVASETWGGPDANGYIANFGYDFVGNMVFATDNNSAVGFEYDGAYRITRTDRHITANSSFNSIISHGYDANGNKTRDGIQVGGGSPYGHVVFQDYDERNRVVVAMQVDFDGQSEISDKFADFQYNADGTVKQIERREALGASGSPSHIIGYTTFGYYVGSGRQYSIKHYSATANNQVGDLEVDYNILYSSQGQVAQISAKRPQVDTNNNTVYTEGYVYDSHGQISQVGGTWSNGVYVGGRPVSSSSTSYGLNGNYVGSGYDTGADNRLNQGLLYDYEYDNEGNRIKRTAYAYDKIFDASDGTSGTRDADASARPIETSNQPNSHASWGWNDATASEAHGDSQERFKFKDGGTLAATGSKSWEFDNLAPGTYDVYASWDGYKDLSGSNVGGLGIFRTSVWTAPKLAEERQTADADFSEDAVVGSTGRTDHGTNWQRIAHQLIVTQHGDKIIVDLGTDGAQAHPNYSDIDRHYLIADAVRIIRTDTYEYETTYEYNHRNQLTKVTDYEDSQAQVIRRTVDYTYDVLGQRITKEVSDTANDYTEHYTQNGGKVAIIDTNYDDAGTDDTREHFFWSPVDGSLLAFEELNTTDDTRLLTSWALQDHTGRIRDLMSRASSSVDSALHMSLTYALGRPHQDSWSWNQFVYTSNNTSKSVRFFEGDQQHDAAVGLIYTGTGYVDPQANQFINQSGGGSNPYRYMGNAGIGRATSADAVSGYGDLLARPALQRYTAWDDITMTASIFGESMARPIAVAGGAVIGGIAGTFIAGPAGTVAGIYIGGATVAASFGTYDRLESGQGWGASLAGGVLDGTGAGGLWTAATGDIAFNGKDDNLAWGGWDGRIFHGVTGALAFAPVLGAGARVGAAGLRGMSGASMTLRYPALGAKQTNAFNPALAISIETAEATVRPLAWAAKLNGPNLGQLAYFAKTGAAANAARSGGSTLSERIDQTPKDGPRGYWTNDRGRSTFIPARNPATEAITSILDDLGLSGVSYRMGKPNFTPFEAGRVSISRSKYTSSRPVLHRYADTLLAKQWGWNRKQVEAYRKANNMVWHELNDVRTLQLVPYDINDYFGHLGGISEATRMGL